MFGSLGVILDGSKKCKEGFVYSQGNCVPGVTLDTHRQLNPTPIPVSVTAPSQIQRTQVAEAFKALRIELGISEKEAEIAGAIVEGIALGTAEGTEYVNKMLAAVDESRHGLLARYLKGVVAIDKGRERRPSELAAINKAISLLEPKSVINTKTLLLGGAGLAAAWFLFIRK